MPRVLIATPSALPDSPRCGTRARWKEPGLARREKPAKQLHRPPPFRQGEGGSHAATDLFVDHGPAFLFSLTESTAPRVLGTRSPALNSGSLLGSLDPGIALTGSEAISLELRPPSTNGFGLNPRGWSASPRTRFLAAPPGRVLAGEGHRGVPRAPTATDFSHSMTSRERHLCILHAQDLHPDLVTQARRDQFEVVDGVGGDRVGEVLDIELRHLR